jgi:hypothetical protein
VGQMETKGMYLPLNQWDYRKPTSEPLNECCPEVKATFCYRRLHAEARPTTTHPIAAQ